MILLYLQITHQVKRSQNTTKDKQYEINLLREFKNICHLFTHKISFRTILQTSCHHKSRLISIRIIMLLCIPLYMCFSSCYLTHKYTHFETWVDQRCIHYKICMNSIQFNKTNSTIDLYIHIDIQITEIIVSDLVFQYF